MSGLAKEAEYMMDVWTNGRRLAKSTLAKYRGNGQKNELELEPSEEGGERAREAKTEYIAEKGRTNLKITVRIGTFLNLVKSLKEDELERASLDKSGNK